MRRHIGTSVPTTESVRHVQGRGTYVDDVDLPDALHAHVLRSPLAHARIAALDAGPARSSAGVAAVFTAADLGPLAAPMPMLFDDPAIAHPRSHVALATDIVRYVGEPVAFVVAASRAEAEDAAEAIRVDYEALGVAADLDAAIAEGAPRVHEDVPGNLAGTVRFTAGDVDAAFDRADRIVRLRVRMDRGAASPLETRGVVVAPSPVGDGLTIWASTQRPVKLRDALAGVLGLAADRIRVLATDVGGGFGAKGMFLYPEEVLVAHAARELHRPVKWIEDRIEHFLATSQLREQHHDLELAVDPDGVVLALRDHFLHDGGAYTPYGLSVPLYTAVTLPGPYRIDAVDITYHVAYTNRTPTCPYRGSGGPFATFAIERSMDRVAAELGIDRLDVRRRNLVQPSPEPYHAALPFADGRPIVHDGTAYEILLDTAVTALDGGDPPPEPERPVGRLRRGRAVVMYAEATGLRSFEGARVRVEASGGVVVAVGTSAQGQGHETMLAQVCADSLGVPLDSVTVIQGDTAAFGWGRGTYGSKVAVVVGNAVAQAAAEVRRLALEAVAVETGADEDELDVRDGVVWTRAGTRAASLGELASRLRYAAGGPQPPASAPGLDATAWFAPERASVAGGAHGVEVEVDVDTGLTRVVRYVVAADAGIAINPAIVTGQVRGGVAQGLGGALLEGLVWSADAELANGTLQGYRLPRTHDLPAVAVTHLATPSKTNELGVKGTGEAGVFACSAAIAAAIEDALDCATTDPIVASPMTPDGIRRRALDVDPGRSADSQLAAATA
jgi:CO/xanthine dehydrogenase Mo-binding subunit